MYRVHPTQVKAARGFLGWTQDQLAEASGVSLTTIRSFESGFTPRTNTINQIRKTFEKYGIEFTDDEGIKPRKENVRILQGTDSCDRLFDDIAQTVNEIDCDVLAYLRTREMRAQPCGLNSKNNFDRLKLIEETTDVKCLLADVPQTSFSTPSFEVRVLPKDIIGPSSFYIYGDKLVTVQFDNRMNFIYVIYNIIGVSQDWRAYFQSMWANSSSQPIPTTNSRSASKNVG